MGGYDWIDWEQGEAGRLQIGLGTGTSDDHGPTCLGDVSSAVRLLDRPELWVMGADTVRATGDSLFSAPAQPGNGPRDGG